MYFVVFETKTYKYNIVNFLEHPNFKETHTLDNYRVAQSQLKHFKKVFTVYKSKENEHYFIFKYNQVRHL